MLTRLSIRDIVLIDRLDIDFSAGLSVLTGETGAGKSILLDAFSLALGARGDAGLVRKGADQGQVTAAFDVGKKHPARALLTANDIPVEDELILRRVQLGDGRTRAFVNDSPVGVQVLKSLAARWSKFTASTTIAHCSTPQRIAGCSTPLVALKATLPRFQSYGQRAARPMRQLLRIARTSSGRSVKPIISGTRWRNYSS